MRIAKFYFIALTILTTLNINAQDNNQAFQNVTINIPEVALLDLEATNSTTINLSPEGPTEAGEALDFSNSTNSDIWINYSSIVGSKTESSRDVTVSITSGSVPQGMTLKVKAGEDAGFGDGKMGTSTSTITLNSNAQKVIQGVGSAYTGNGPSKGHQLTYELSLDNEKGSYAALDFDQSNTIAVTYTLTDQ